MAVPKKRRSKEKKKKHNNFFFKKSTYIYFKSFDFNNYYDNLNIYVNLKQNHKYIKRSKREILIKYMLYRNYILKERKPLIYNWCFFF